MYVQHTHTHTHTLTHTHIHTDATENITFPLSRLVINRKLNWDSRLELIVFRMQTVNQALRQQRALNAVLRI